MDIVINVPAILHINPAPTRLAYGIFFSKIRKTMMSEGMVVRKLTR